MRRSEYFFFQFTIAFKFNENTQHFHIRISFPPVKVKL